jgi:hypothetical protein
VAERVPADVNRRQRRPPRAELVDACEHVRRRVAFHSPVDDLGVESSGAQLALEDPRVAELLGQRAAERARVPQGQQPQPRAGCVELGTAVARGVDLDRDVVGRPDAGLLLDVPDRELPAVTALGLE